MTLYGIGLGPGEADLVTVRGKAILESVDVVYSPGRLSRTVAAEHVPEDRIGDLEFPMTRDEQTLRAAWKAAAEEVAPQARDGDVAFVTLGDPNVYSTFGHLRRTIAAFHPDVDFEFESATAAFLEAGSGEEPSDPDSGSEPPNSADGTERADREGGDTVSAETGERA